MPEQLPTDATIISIYDGLTYPSKYARGVLHKMLGCVRAHGNATVRIGITGTGQKPCYRVCYTDSAGNEQIFGSWWDMGDPLATEDAVNQNWSTRVVSHKELEDFLSDKLGHRGPRPSR